MEDKIADKVNRIRIWKPETIIRIDNPAGYRLVGKGKQGAVFQIDEQRCVKIYYRSESCRRELHALRLGGQAGICPKIYFWGRRFIVMEYLTAPSLYDYLQEEGMTRELAESIIRLFDTFEQSGFNRFDHSMRHIFMLPDGQMKIIDVVHVIKPAPVYFPRKLLSDLGAFAPEFMQHTSIISPKWYKLWSNHMEYEEVLANAQNNG